MGFVGFVFTCGSFIILWALGLLFASTDRFVTVADMQSHGVGFERGIPWDAHLAIKYLDALPFPILMGLWVGICGKEWTGNERIGFLVAGFVLSAGMHYTYIGAGKNFPEVTTYYGTLPPIFWEHLTYMGFGLTIVGLGYCCSYNPPPWLVWTSTIYLVIHITIGVHVIHKLLAPTWFPYHGILDVGTLAPIIGAIVALLGMTWWALR